MGPTLNKDLLYGGRLLGADEAVATGLVGRVVEDADLEDEVDALLALWGTQPSSALRAAKSAVDTGLAPLTRAAQQLSPTPATDRREMPRRVCQFLLQTQARRSRPKAVMTTVSLPRT